MSGVATIASKSVQLSFWIFSTRSSAPTKSGAGGAGLVGLVALGHDGARASSCPVPWGSTTAPRTI
jgi:hypothetical protein